MNTMPSLKLIPALLLLLVPTLVRAEYRDFTDKQGRVMNAELINVIGKEVRLKRDDGAAFTVDPSIFCEEDENYIRLWMVKSLSERDSLLDLSARSAETSAKEVSGSDLVKAKKWDGYYKIEIENKSDLNLEELKVEYAFLVFHMNPGAKSRDDGKTEVVKKDLTIPMLSGRGEFAFDTAKAEMLSTDLASNAYWTDGGKDSSKDKLEGIWIRLYYRDQLIMDWSNPSSMKEKYNWAKLK